MKQLAKRLAAAVLTCASLLITGCASVAPKPTQVLAEDDVRIIGRLSVQVAGNGGRATGGNAGFELIGNPRAGQLELSTPLGSLLARASWGPDEATLQTPEAERSFADLDGLIRELLGEAIPVAALFDWLRGRPWPQLPSEAWVEPQVGFSQLGWRIDLARFSEGVIVATRQAEPAVTLRARVEP